ncbi:MAG TPA: DUF433 domain-containing protein [Candidatus Solibacter sp.]|nr:DUF433 domain-containing protein [Candidatus Solibacter sp.]
MSGTRVPFQTLCDYLESGQTLDEFLDDFPSVARGVAVQALEIAKALSAERTRFVAEVNVGLAAADRGDVVEHEEVRMKLDQILRD